MKMPSSFESKYEHPMENEMDQNVG